MVMIAPAIHCSISWHSHCNGINIEITLSAVMQQTMNRDIFWSNNCVYKCLLAMWSNQLTRLFPTNYTVFAVLNAIIPDISSNLGSCIIQHI